MPRGFFSRITTIDSSGVGIPARDERVGGVDRWHALKI